MIDCPIKREAAPRCACDGRDACPDCDDGIVRCEGCGVPTLDTYLVLEGTHCDDCATTAAAAGEAFVCRGCSQWRWRTGGDRAGLCARCAPSPWADPRALAGEVLTGAALFVAFVVGFVAWGLVLG